MQQEFNTKQLEALFTEAAKVCAESTLPYFRNSSPVDNKLAKGFDPVTQADKNTEHALRILINKHFPDHGIIGEEHADHQADAQYCWVIDPIDGTRAFISGLPSWGCLLGLTDNGKPIAGMMHQPYTQETWYTLGNESFFHRNKASAKISTSPVDQLVNATLMSTAPEIFTKEKFERFENVGKKAQLIRYGFDCYAYVMLACGQVELVIESGLQAYDIVPLIPIIENAGGTVTTWDGKPANTGGDIIASANPTIHEQALALLNG